MGCSTCSGQKVFARGYCQACYYRLRRNGTVERKNVVRGARCLEGECGKPSFAKNLCKLHYDKAQHPMKATWKLLRSRNKGLYPASWDRFDAFLADVGERPTPQHQLRRLDGNEPFSKQNVRWVALAIKAPDPNSKAYHQSYGREWNLRDSFGLTGEDYTAMSVRQGNVCAICEQPETAIHHKTGEPRALAVDHNHKTGAVRGLLCRDCNLGLGLFEDDRDILARAQAYLDAHRPTEP